MANFNRLQWSSSGLAHTLHEPSPLSPPLAPNPATGPFISPQNNCARAWQEQQAAINILLDQQDDIIFAYLRFARSLNRNVYYLSGQGPLSSDQIFAVCALRDCNDNEIKAWLEQARKLSSDSEQSKHPQGNAFQEPGLESPSLLGQSRGSLRSPSVGASIGAPFDVFRIGSSHQSTPNASRVHTQQSLDKINTSHGATKAAKLYWCTICEDRHSYKNLSDWRKHEKEHVDTYVCMLGGPLELTDGGFKCILCGTLNPSEKHLDTHNIQKCGQGVPGSFSCKRRTDLVRHLRNGHNVQAKAQGEAIADKWKETTKRQAWSCGFCIHLAYTFGDRLKHIATHFESGQTLDKWDTTKVIEGLLSQPRMIDAWKTQLDFSMSWESPNLIWEKHFVKDLQHDLEVGPSDPKHAATLAKAAYEACQTNGDLLSVEKSFAMAPVSGALWSNGLKSASKYDPITERALQPNSNHDQSQFVANPAEALHYGAPPLGRVPMATSDYSTFPTSSLDDGNSSIKDPWLLDPDQVWSSAADQRAGSNGYQNYSNATTLAHIGPGPPVFSDKQGTDITLPQGMWD